jgi:hypothetical protein
VNAPSANACRTCGRWPSLFDLQSGAVDNGVTPEQAPTETQTPTPEDWSLPDDVEPVDESPEQASTRRDLVAGEPNEAERSEAAATAGNEKRASWPGPEPSIPSMPSGRRMRRLTRLALPIVLVVYFVIRAVTNH